MPRPIAVAALTAAGPRPACRVARRVAAGRRALDATGSSRTNGLGGVWSRRSTRDAEITPPLYFLLAWLGDAARATRPRWRGCRRSLAGVATIPLVYLLGPAHRRPRPRRSTAAAVVALAPFMIYYSAEARGYALMMPAGRALHAVHAARAGHPQRALVGRSTRSARARRCTPTTPRPSCSRPSSAGCCGRTRRRAAPALIANVARGGGLPALALRAARRPRLADHRDPVRAQPVRPGTRPDLRSTHCDGRLPLRPCSGCASCPASPRVVLFVAGAALGSLRTRGRGRAQAVCGRRSWPASTAGCVLVRRACRWRCRSATALVSAVGTNLFSTRNLAASWPGYALASARCSWRPGRACATSRSRCVLACLAVGRARRSLDDSTQRPDFEAAAELHRRATPGRATW